MEQRLTPPRSVIYKLLGFTLAMVAAPIGTYFMTVNTIFKGFSLVSVKRRG
jgi:vacuolar ATPase assembly integral membrane protein VMA21